MPTNDTSTLFSFTLFSLTIIGKTLELVHYFALNRVCLLPSLSQPSLYPTTTRIPSSPTCLRHPEPGTTSTNKHQHPTNLIIRATSGPPLVVFLRIMSSTTTSNNSASPRSDVTPSRPLKLSSDPGWQNKTHAYGRCYCACMKTGHVALEVNLKEAEDGSGRTLCGGCYDRAGKMGTCG